MTQVIVQLAPAPASETGIREHAACTRAKEFGTSLTAIHPHSTDPLLAGWYSAQVDTTRAGEFFATLRRIPDVTAAYVKPRAAMP